MENVNTLFDYDENIHDENILGLIGSAYDSGDTIEYVKTGFSFNENMLNYHYGSDNGINHDGMNHGLQADTEKISSGNTRSKHEQARVCIVVPTYNEVHNILAI